MSHTQRHVNSTNEGGFESNHVSDTGTGTVMQAIGKHTTQQNAGVKSIINKDRHMAPKRMPFGAHLAMNTHNMWGRFVESVKIARWSMISQEVGDGLERIVEYQVQIKGHNQQECGDIWQGWQNGLMKSLRQN